MLRRLKNARFAAGLVLMTALAACGAVASPSPSAASGSINVTVDDQHGTSFFNAVHRARVVSLDGAEVGAWELVSGAPPIELPVGTYRLEAFTVFLSDFMECPEEPGSTCFQPTLEPITVCKVDLDVPPGGEARAVFTSLPDGLCRLEAVDAGPT